MNKQVYRFYETSHFGRFALTMVYTVTFHPSPSLATVPQPLPQERAWHQHAAAWVWGHQYAASVSPRLPKPYNCSLSQTSWQALCCRKTRCLKQATAVIVGSCSKTNSGIRQYKESPGVLMQPHICEEYIMPVTAEVSLTWCGWRKACSANSKLIIEYSPAKDL